MNPALVLVVALTAGGALASRRRPAAVVAVLVAGLGATALLGPVLLRANGIPSPTGNLSRHAPWQDLELGDLRPELRDVTYQIEPWLLFLRERLRAGELPLWNPRQGAGSPFWSNGQSAPLFPLHLLFALSTVQSGLVLLPWLRIAIAVLGARALARELGVGSSGALLSGISYGLAGMPVSFALFPMGNALALVPWVWWATERLLGGRRRASSVLAIVVGLQLLAGHPETVVHTALVTGVYLLVRGVGRDRWAPLALGWAGGAGLAAVQLLPLVLFLPRTARWHADLASPGWSQIVDLVLPQAARLLLPRAFGDPGAGEWWGPVTPNAFALYAGILTLLFAGCGLGLARTERPWRGVAAALAVSVAGAFHLPGVRELLELPPVLGRALHHRLVFGVVLSLALLAGAGLDRWRRGRGRGQIIATAAALGVGIGACWFTLAGEWHRRGLVADNVAWTVLALGSVLLLLGAPENRRRSRVVVVLVLVVAGTDLVAAHGSLVPVSDAADLYPPTGAVAALEGREGRVAALGAHLHPNAATVYGLADVRIDDTLLLARYDELLDESFGGGDPTGFSPLERWPSRWLDRLGVRWVLGPPGSEPPVPVAERERWSLAYDGDDARIWERPGARPLVRLVPPGNGRMRVEAKGPERWELEVTANRPGTVVLAVVDDGGWTATVDGRPTRTTLHEGLFPSASVPEGTTRIVFRYLPPGFVAGAITSAATAGLLLGLAILRRYRRPRGSRDGMAEDAG